MQGERGPSRAREQAELKFAKFLKHVDGTGAPEDAFVFSHTHRESGDEARFLQIPDGVGPTETKEPHSMCL